MKGIILAGDSGSRLHPLTIAVPKQLLPVYDKPMVYYPLKTLVDAGITDIMVITTSEHQALFQKYLGDGSQFGAKLTYACQDEPRGIAEALTIAKDFIDKTGVCLTTGDNVLVGTSFSPYLKSAENAIVKSGSATIFTTNEQFEDQYGKVLKKANGKSHSIVGAESHHFYDSIVGCYVYPADAVKLVDELVPSERGRLEITELNQKYFQMNKLQVICLKRNIAWLDVNTPATLLSSANQIKNQYKYEE